MKKNYEKESFSNKRMKLEIIKWRNGDISLNLGLGKRKRKIYYSLSENLHEFSVDCQKLMDLLVRFKKRSGKTGLTWFKNKIKAI